MLYLALNSSLFKRPFSNSRTICFLNVSEYFRSGKHFFNKFFNCSISVDFVVNFFQDETLKQKLPVVPGASESVQLFKMWIYLFSLSKKIHYQYLPLFSRQYNGPCSV